MENVETVGHHGDASLVLRKLQESIERALEELEEEVGARHSEKAFLEAVEAVRESRGWRSSHAEPGSDECALLPDP